MVINSSIYADKQTSRWIGSSREPVDLTDHWSNYDNLYVVRLLDWLKRDRRFEIPWVN